MKFSIKNLKSLKLFVQCDKKIHDVFIHFPRFRKWETISCLYYCQFYGKTRLCSDDIAHSFVPNVLNCSRFAAPCNSTTISVTYKVVTLKFIVVGGMVLSFPCPFHFVEIFHLNILFIS